MITRKVFCGLRWKGMVRTVDFGNARRTFSVMASSHFCGMMTAGVRMMVSGIRNSIGLLLASWVRNRNGCAVIGRPLSIMVPPALARTYACVSVGRVLA